MTHLELYRPQFHFSAAKGWINDPNGLVYLDGIWHMFYQHFPDLPIWGPMHWGHAVSKDLMHWEERPIALYPDADLGMAFSGSAVMDYENTCGLGSGDNPPLVLVLTHAGGRDGTQKQSLAYSLDKGTTFSLYPDNPVLPNPGARDFRDPKVFRHAPSGDWIMVLAVGDHVAFYRSSNLLRWTHLSDFGPGYGHQRGVWECPDLFELPILGGQGETRWVLQVDVGDSAPWGGSGGQYFVGTFDGTAFVADEAPETVRWLDQGPDFYAFQSWSNVPPEDGRRLGVAWMSNWLYALKTPIEEGGWRGAMTLPRELLLKRNGAGELVVCQRPVEAFLNSCKKTVCQDDDRHVVTDGELELPVSGDRLAIAFQADQLEAAEIGLKMFCGGEQEVVVGIDISGQTFFFDRTKSGRTDFHADFPARLEVLFPIPEGRVELLVVIDRSSVEVFSNDVGLAFTARVFPLPENLGLKVFVRNGTARFFKIQVDRVDTICK
jgi:fructan beta-fructosidase